MSHEMKYGAHRVSPEQLMVYLDGELPAEEAMPVAEHLSECIQCQMLAVEFSEASVKMQVWRVETPGAEGLEMSPQLSAAWSEMATTCGMAKPAPHLSFGRALVSLVALQWIRPVWARGLAFGFVFLMVVGLLILSAERRVYYARMTAGDPHYSAAMAPSAEVHRLLDQGAPTPLEERSREALLARLASPEPQGTSEGLATLTPPEAVTPRMLVKTAQLTLTTRQFEQVRNGMEVVLSRYRGYVGHLNVTAPPNSGRVLAASLKIPADRLDNALSDLKKLGHVDSESVNADEVTQQYVDVSARLTNARKTEQRLNELILTRTGKITDVLEVERYRAHTREEIERMDAEKKSLEGQAQFSTVQLTVNEEYKAQLQGGRRSSDNKLWNAAVEGYAFLVENLLGIATFVLVAGPTLLFWCALLGVPFYFAWRKWLRGRLKAS